MAENVSGLDSWRNAAELREMLTNPHLWVGRQPLEIKKLVIRAGGWNKVFHRGLPKWAHFIRQMFNYEPTKLERMREDSTEILISMATGTRVHHGTLKNQVAAKAAPSGDVYNDARIGRNQINGWKYWIEQSQTGTRYHYSRGQKLGDIGHTLYAAVTPHSWTSVFKLCLPDGTGGSCETVIENRFEERSLLKQGEIRGVSWWIVKDDRYRGSYNYGDTMAIGYDIHEKLDVEPDNKWGSNYVNENQMSELQSRIFRIEHFRHLDYYDPYSGLGTR